MEPAVTLGRGSVTDTEVPEAHLDPWCATPVDGGDTRLFGFSIRHPLTGGLGWLVSTELLALDAAAGRASTRSGRQYLLGRRFDPIDVGGEGDEARTAFRYLLENEFDGVAALRELDRLWLIACKAARHLDMEPPARRSTDVRTFLQSRGAAYLVARERRKTR